MAESEELSVRSIVGRLLARLLALMPWSKQTAECVFCKITTGNDADAQIHYHDSKYIVITDISPTTTHHYLVIPKEHIRDAKCLDDTHIPMINEMKQIGQKVLESRGGSWKDCRYGFHWPPFISVSHLHMHIISPQSGLSTKNDLVFKPDSYWFHTAEALIGMLERLKPPATQAQTPMDELDVNLK